MDNLDNQCHPLPIVILTSGSAGREMEAESLTFSGGHPLVESGWLPITPLEFISCSNPTSTGVEKAYTNPLMSENLLICKQRGVIIAVAQAVLVIAPVLRWYHSDPQWEINFSEVLRPSSSLHGRVAALPNNPCYPR